MWTSRLIKNGVVGYYFYVNGFGKGMLFYWNKLIMWFSTTQHLSSMWATVKRQGLKQCFLNFFKREFYGLYGFYGHLTTQAWNIVVKLQQNFKYPVLGRDPYFENHWTLKDFMSYIFVSAMGAKDFLVLQEINCFLFVNVA